MEANTVSRSVARCCVDLRRHTWYTRTKSMINPQINDNSDQFFHVSLQGVLSQIQMNSRRYYLVSWIPGVCFYQVCIFVIFTLKGKY